MVIPTNNDIIVYGYILAENNTDAENVVVWSQSKKRTVRNTDKMHGILPHLSFNQVVLYFNIASEKKECSLC
jgi:hypothetical protein